MTTNREYYASTIKRLERWIRKERKRASEEESRSPYDWQRAARQGEMMAFDATLKAITTQLKPPASTREGKACKHDGTHTKYTCNGSCVRCTRARQEARRSREREKRKGAT